jgi:hypothetical protein
MKSQTLEIDERFGEEYRGKYVFKEMTWAKRSESSRSIPSTTS